MNMPRFSPNWFYRHLPRRPVQFAGSLLAGIWLAAFCFSFLGISPAQEVSRKVIARTVPAYPELAKRIHASGKVKLEVVVAPSGAVKSVRMVGGNPVFEKNAVDAVKQWRFESSQVETTGTITLEFADQ